MKTFLTAQGVALLATVIGDDTATLHFVKAEFGSGQWPVGNETDLNDAIKAATELSHPVLDVLYNNDDVVIQAENSLVLLQTEFTNTEIDTSFHVTEIGYWAVNSKLLGAEPILFAVSATDQSTAAYVPKYDERVATFNFDCYVYVGDLANVTAAVSAASVKANKEDLDKHIQRRDNPHGVTKEQVGLGLVPNVSTDNQTPTVGEEVFEKVATGNTLSAMFGKVAAYFSKLKEHIENIKDENLAKNVGNPHGTTAEQVGAAPIKHYHSAADINRDVLAEKFGGTGLSKSADFAGKDSTRDVSDYGTSESYTSGYAYLPGDNNNKVLVQWGRINVDGHQFACRFKKNYADTDYVLVFPTCGKEFIPVWKNPEKRTSGFTMARTFGVDSSASNFGITLLGLQLAKFVSLISAAANIRNLSDVISWFGMLKSSTDVTKDNIVKVFGASQTADWIAIGKAAK